MTQQECNVNLEDLLNNKTNYRLIQHAVEVGRLTEKPNRYPIFFQTDTDTDFGILKTGKYRIPTKNNRKTDIVGYFPVS